MSVVFLVCAIAFVLYYRVMGPLTSKLDLDVEIEAPEDVAVSVKPTMKRSRGYRGAHRGWNVGLRVRVTNLTKHPLYVGKVKVRFYDTAGNRMRTGGGGDPINLDVLKKNRELYLAPGGTKTYSSLLSYHLKLGMGKKCAKCIVSVHGVKRRE